MEQFATEEQQVEAIKRFWKEIGMAIVVGAVLGFGGLFGWRYYSDSQIMAKEAASLEYQSVVENLSSEGGIARAESFLSEYSSSGYAPLMALVLAQQSIDAGDLEGAIAQLQVAANSGDASIDSLASIRIARVQLELDNAQQALETLNALEDEAFTSQIETLKGDAYSQLADFAKARLAYGAAVDADENNRLAKMKLDNLAVTAGS